MDTFNMEMSILSDEYKISMLMNESDMFYNSSNKILNESISDKLKSMKDAVIKFFKFIKEKIKSIFNSFVSKIKEMYKNIKIKKFEFYQKLADKNLKKSQSMSENYSVLSESSSEKTPKVILDAFNFFSKDYKGEEIVFGETTYGNALMYYNMNARNFFDVMLKDKLAKVVKKPNNADELKELVDKIEETKSTIKENALHYMTSSGQKTSESSFKNDIINYYINKTSKKEITSQNIKQYTVDDLIDIAFKGNKWLNWLNESYRDFDNNLKQAEKLVQTTCTEESNTEYVNSCLSLTKTITNLSLSVIEAGNQINVHYRSSSDKVLDNIVSNYIRLNK